MAKKKTGVDFLDTFGANRDLYRNQLDSRSFNEFDEIYQTIKDNDFSKGGSANIFQALVPGNSNNSNYYNQAGNYQAEAGRIKGGNTLYDELQGFKTSTISSSWLGLKKTTNNKYDQGGLLEQLNIALSGGNDLYKTRAYQEALYDTL